MRVCMLSCFNCVWLIETIWTIAHHAPLFMGLSRQEYWSVMPCSPPGDLLNPGTEPASLMSPVLAGGFFTTSTTWEVPVGHIHACKLKKKFKHLTKLWSNHSVLRHEPRGNWDLGPYKDLQKYGQSSFTCNSQKIEASEKFLIRWVE